MLVPTLLAVGLESGGRVVAPPRATVTLGNRLINRATTVSLSVLAWLRLPPMAAAPTGVTASPCMLWGVPAALPTLLLLPGSPPASGPVLPFC